MEFSWSTGFFIKIMGEILSINSEDPLSCKKKSKKEKTKNLALFLLLVLFVVVCLMCFGNSNVVSGVQGDFEESVSLENQSDENQAINLFQEVEKNDLDKLVDYANESVEVKQKKELEKELYEMVQGHPIEQMVPYIAEYDKEIAALIVGIGKKESNWGKRSPLKNNGDTCYNYWGYKGAGSEGVAMGHGCFGSPKEAVDAIGGRIKELVDQGLNTPSKMIVWKCGRSCAGHAPGSPEKWISDVSIYYNQIISG